MSFLPKDYVGVHTRVEQFHEKYKDGSIETEFDIKGDIVVFKATVKFEGRVFNGSSFGKANKEKAFEKLETVAVGRALAFAGFEIKAGIASQDEMDNFQSNMTQEEVESVFESEELGGYYCSKCGVANETIQQKEGKYGPYFRCKDCNGFSALKKPYVSEEISIEEPPF